MLVGEREYRAYLRGYAGWVVAVPWVRAPLPELGLSLAGLSLWGEFGSQRGGTVAGRWAPGSSGAPSPAVCACSPPRRRSSRCSCSPSCCRGSGRVSSAWRGSSSDARSVSPSRSPESTSSFPGWFATWARRLRSTATAVSSAAAGRTWWPPGRCPRSPPRRRSCAPSGAGASRLCSVTAGSPSSPRSPPARWPRWGRSSTCRWRGGCSLRRRASGSSSPACGRRCSHSPRRGGSGAPRATAADPRGGHTAAGARRVGRRAAGAERHRAGDAHASLPGDGEHRATAGGGAAARARSPRQRARHALGSGCRARRERRERPGERLGATTARRRRTCPGAHAAVRTGGRTAAGGAPRRGKRASRPSIRRPRRRRGGR